MQIEDLDKSKISPCDSGAPQTTITVITEVEKYSPLDNDDDGEID